MIMLPKKIDMAIISIDNTTNLFYQNKIDVGYKELDETLQIISDAIDGILRHEDSIGYKSTSETKLVDILSEAMKALELRDTLLLADILQYDLKGILVELRDSLM